MTRFLIPFLCLAALAACGRGDAGTAAPEAPEPPRLPAAQATCLAKAAYFEARGEGRSGMAAVAHVVMNRAAHDAYPETPCGVVEQRRGTSCQFSWACDGLSDEPGDPDLYLTARRVADAVAHGDAPDPTGGATMFHAARVTPYWTAEAEHTATIGRHLFYRLDE